MTPVPALCGHNGYCTVIGNDLFAYNSRSDSKSRENYLRLLRGQYEDYILNEYARTYLIAQQLPQSHLIKLQFSSARVAQGKADWQAYLQRLDFTCQQAVKRVTEAAMFGSAIEHGLSPDLILRKCWSQTVCHPDSCTLLETHMERGIRARVGGGILPPPNSHRLPGNTALSRQEIEAVTDRLMELLPPASVLPRQAFRNRTAATARAL